MNWNSTEYIKVNELIRPVVAVGQSWIVAQSYSAAAVAVN